MTQSKTTNRRIVLNQRPVGEPDENTLRLEEAAVPEAGDGEMLLRTIWLSLDPYMRGRMNDAKSYAEPVKLGEVMTGEVVAEVDQPIRACAANGKVEKGGRQPSPSTLSPTARQR